MCGSKGSKSAPPPAPVQAVPTGPVVANYSNVDQRRPTVATSTNSQLPGQGTPLGEDLKGTV